MSDSILSTTEGGVAVITLNRQAKLNAWDTPMREELTALLYEMNADDAVGAIVVTGAGEQAFSAGQDLGETMAFTTGEDAANWFLSWRPFYDSARNLDKGFVAALNGVAAGSAFQFAMLADIRVGHVGSKMGQPEINSGIPSVLGPMLMNARLGLSRAIELTLSGRMMDGQECFDIGLIHHLVEPPQVLDKAKEVAGELAGKPPLAMRLNKRRFKEVTQPAFDEAFEKGAAIEAQAFAAGEPQQAMADFFEARKR